ncbi:IclR family transcriptional regulator [Hydrogenophaga sp. BPS33]|uniref:IclR family transcriptional regulator n=1 Tax=Hydrogenophaga sp. BPS33 TaxID=2651974 RepID=UPI00132015D4|nr:helix-turn-helix domain-containing protein [Hydrogenophaga sp. BPS33]QHE83696.1 helix-turn-helix domain-containing protein [Hydrogenophaga sp. BPS33]
MGREVKSAVRVLEVLELFDRLQREATVGEIARELGYPVSSTSMLLSSLLEYGYLRHGPDKRSYFPTPRVTLLGAWIEPLLSPTSEMLRMMAELSDKTGETIILAGPTRDQAQYLHVVPATTTMRMHVGPGTMRPLVASGLGRLLLSTMSDEKVRHLVLRHNGGDLSENELVSLAALRRELNTIRARGYSVMLRGVTPGAGLIGMLLPMTVDGLPLAVGIGGWAREMRTRQLEYVTLLRDAIARHLGAPKRANG